MRPLVESTCLTSLLNQETSRRMRQVVEIFCKCLLFWHWVSKHYNILTVSLIFVYGRLLSYLNILIKISSCDSLFEDTCLCQVRSGYCRLSWDAPDDDGGTPIQQYLVNMMDLTVNEWVTAAETGDKSVEIKGLKPGHLYRFEVFAVNKEGNSPSVKLKESHVWRCSPLVLVNSFLCLIISIVGQ